MPLWPIDFLEMLPGRPTVYGERNIFSIGNAYLIMLIVKVFLVALRCRPLNMVTLSSVSKPL